MDNLRGNPSNPNNNNSSIPPFGSDFNPHINNPVPNGIVTNPIDPNNSKTLSVVEEGSLTDTRNLFRPKVARFCRRQILIYQEQLLKVQEEAKQKKLGMWSL